MNWFSRVAFVVLMLMFLAAPGHAAVYSSIDDIFLSGSAFMTDENPRSWQGKDALKGTFDFVYLGAEADHTNVLLKKSSGETIFNTDYTAKDTWARGLEISSLKLDDLDVNGFLGWGNKQYKISSWSDVVHIYQLTSDVIVSGVSLTTGMFIFGFNDDYKQWPCDHPDFDDMVFAAKAVPIPGAALLLGAGLLGIVGVRRKQAA
ncbi:VPLPA-CTERM protein sorting domain-containing protein [Desulfomicrobium norvegicum]|uniref:VPLPA-CTERM protein sorting domain-containing protein n=1 Tax=Desulfomicrobium norvegicum (strain DSM 1741 / NCIMB 8310) TaxID=52561 RepID=A0A8G2FG36_DESNO|nr:hypothetical protein [Desulfomicrobium norvegicum]SFM21678.1 VPLPA-CTERM protein sorting domain-containing protein [Desulfomicrobium norvegicum]